MRTRTLIMVVSMIVLPVAAVVGVKVPEFLRFDGVWKRDEAKAPPAQEPLNRRALASADKSAAAGKSAPSDAKLPGESLNHPVVRVGNIDVRAAEPGMLQQAVNEEPAYPQTATPAAHEIVSSSEQFLQIQHRLRSLGATHYCLETWGTTGEAYRFQCRMAAGHDLNYSRHFEATDTDPLRVMQAVLQEVESWKAGRLP